MKKRIFCKLLMQLMILILILSPLLVYINCQSSQESGITVSVYSSSLDGDRLTKMEDIYFREGEVSELPGIIINEDSTFQKIDGFGASFNEAGMICLNSLNAEEQDHVFKKLFDPQLGAGFTLMKSPIGACDFSSAGSWYSYNDTPGDTLMEHFTIERDLGSNGLVTFIKKASQFGKFKIESPMDFAPDWMYFGLGQGEKHIKPEYYPALARYYSKYIQAYAENGITIDYLNLFNEANNSHYSNVTYKAMGEMIKNHVVPHFKADGVSVEIQLGETQTRYEALEKFPAILDDPEVRKHIHSFTVHAYDWDQFSSLTKLHEKYPNFPIWMTEICYAPVFGGSIEAKLDTCPVYDFSDGEFWGNMIINDLKNWVSGWIYWNMILDQDGGPWLVSPEHSNPENNLQHPVVIINRETKEVAYTGLYYYLAHFSKFVKPGAYRINCTGGSESLNYVGFINADGNIVLNVINNGKETSCKILWGSKMSIQKLKAHSITTIKWKSK